MYARLARVVLRPGQGVGGRWKKIVPAADRALGTLKTPHLAVRLQHSSGRRQYDATATKPSAVCDPYENKGEPLSQSQCAEYLPSVSQAWKLAEDHSSLTREIEVGNFMKGAKLLTTLAAVSFNDGHFPHLALERRVGRGRRWQEFVVVKCQTVVLGGLSYRDFQLAILMDVELEKLSV